jgi:hypothetical protein
LPHRILQIVVALVIMARVLPAQGVVVVLPGRGHSGDRGFSGFASAPISATTVLHSYMESADSGAVLGFAVALRGTPQWYNVHVQFHTMLKDSLPPEATGQSWTVGSWTYRLIYSAARKTLTVFDTTITLDSSRVVLISLPARADERPRFQVGAPVSLSMREPADFAPLFLPKAGDVRSFAGIP